jgi:uncharacterized protein
LTAGAPQIDKQRDARRTPGTRYARRIELVDALRAFALAGILQVNIQSFVWGAGDPLGYFGAPPSAIDTLVHVLIGTLVSIKFMSIFAFLFGVGFALQWRSIRRRSESIDIARRVYRRRLLFLLAVGLAHGAVLYYGDILAFYALCGFIVLLFADVPARRLAAAVRNAWIAFAIWSLAWLALLEASRLAFAPEEDPAQLPASAVARFMTYTAGGYVEQLFARVGDFVYALLSTVALSTPHVVALFLLGALAGRLGWLTRPGRHPQLWRRAIWIGVAAAPLALAGAWLNFVEMRDQPADPGALGYALQLAGSLTACLYVAVFVRNRDGLMRPVIAWLAPAGRMPLTNYLLQSVAMGALLSGWGLGLGAELARAQLALLGLALVAVQLVASRAWIAKYGQGPVEAAWRAWTYRAPASSSTLSQTPR